MVFTERTENSRANERTEEGIERSRRFPPRAVLSTPEEVCECHTVSQRITPEPENPHPSGRFSCAWSGASKMKALKKKTIGHSTTSREERTIEITANAFMSAYTP